MSEREKSWQEHAASPDLRKAFGQFSSLKTQRIRTMKPVEIQLDTREEIAGGVRTIDFDGGEIIIKQSGMYLIITGPQVGKYRGSKSRWIDFWLRVNNVDLPNSNIRRVITDSQEKDVISLNVVTALKRGDTLNIMMAAESDNEGMGIEYIEPDMEPSIPSIITTIVQLA
jgi:hypothetical protein